MKRVAFSETGRTDKNARRHGRSLSARVNQLSATHRKIKETAGRMPGRLWLAAAALATATAGAGLALGGQWVVAWARQQWGFL